MLCFSPEATSRAETLTIPFVSMSNVTSTSGSPAGASRMPVSANSPSRSFSAAMSLSPWSTRILTVGCPSRVVVKIPRAEVGTVVFRSIIRAHFPP